MFVLWLLNDKRTCLIQRNCLTNVDPLLLNVYTTYSSQFMFQNRLIVSSCSVAVNFYRRNEKYQVFRTFVS